MNSKQTIIQNYNLAQKYLIQMLDNSGVFEGNRLLLEAFTDLCSKFLENQKLFNVPIDQQQPIQLMLKPSQCFAINCALQTVNALVEKEMLADMEHIKSVNQEIQVVVNKDKIVQLDNKSKPAKKLIL